MQNHRCSGDAAPPLCKSQRLMQQRTSRLAKLCYLRVVTYCTTVPAHGQCLEYCPAPSIAQLKPPPSGAQAQLMHVQTLLLYSSH